MVFQLTDEEKYGNVTKFRGKKWDKLPIDCWDQQ